MLTGTALMLLCTLIFLESPTNYITFASRATVADKVQPLMLFNKCFHPWLLAPMTCPGNCSLHWNKPCNLRTLVSDIQEFFAWTVRSDVHGRATGAAVHCFSSDDSASNASCRFLVLVPAWLVGACIADCMVQRPEQE